MNKLTFIISIVFLMVSITLLADSMATVDVASGINANVSSDIDASFSGILAFFSTFFDILTFQVDGIPTIINLLFFLPISIGMIYIISTIIKDVIPFT